MDNLKVCFRCKQALPMREFWRDKSTKDGLYPCCKGCYHRIKPTIPAGMKQCAKCKAIKPATTEYSHKAHRSTDGLISRCKACRSRAIHPKDTTVKTGKICRICGTEKPFSDLVKSPSCTYGVARLCKVCHKDQCKIRHLRNKERDAENNRQWAQNNKEKVRQARRRWDEKNPIQRLARTRNRRAKIRLAQGAHNAEDVKRQYERQKGKCYWCQQPVGNSYHVDHVIPIDRGGSNGPENIVISCARCNESKQNKLPHEWSGNGGKLL